MKIYNLPTFTTTIEFLTMLALNTGRLLKGGTPDILAAARQVLIDWNHHKIPFFSIPPVLHAAHIPSRAAAAAGQQQQIAPGAEMTGNAQIVSALGEPFVLDGLFGEADAEAMEVEDDVRVGMQIDDDDHNDESTPNPRKRARARSPDGDAPRAPKRKRRLLAVRSASLPSASMAVRSRRAERQARRRRERAPGTTEGVMEIDNNR